MTKVAILAAALVGLSSGAWAGQDETDRRVDECLTWAFIKQSPDPLRICKWFVPEMMRRDHLLETCMKNQGTDETLCDVVGEAIGTPPFWDLMMKKAMAR